MESGIDLGKLMHKVRKERQLTLKFVADKLEIDLTMLSKIEHGERQIQSHMLKKISELFELDYKQLCVEYFSQKLNENYGDSPYIKEAAKTWLSKI